jgi:hypothetical protein
MNPWKKYSRDWWMEYIIPLAMISGFMLLLIAVSALVWWADRQWYRPYMVKIAKEGAAQALEEKEHSK